MKSLSELIKNKKAKIGVVGLGYVGTPVAGLVAKKGFFVWGFDIVEEKINQINQGENPIKGKEPGLSDLLTEVVKKGRLVATNDFSKIKEINVVIVAVETPTDEKGVPHYEALKKALKSIGENLQKETLIIVESTLAPGTMDNLVKPILEKISSLKAGEDFYLVHCPERVMPGRLLRNLQKENRVIGGINKESAELARLFYQNFVEGDLDITDMLTAEMVKTTENTYRDVEIALANEIALICEKMGIDFFELRKLVNKSSFRNLHLAGAGVGGHCIPKDPLLLVYGAKQYSASPSLIPLARKINNFMPLHMWELTEQALKEKRIDYKKAKIAILGVAYLEESDDTRNSPSLVFFKEAKKKGVKNLEAHDPYVQEEEIEGLKIEKDLERVVKEADVLVFFTAHDLYKNLDLQKIKPLLRNPIIIDGRNIFDKNKVEKIGFLYKGVGK